MNMCLLSQRPLDTYDSNWILSVRPFLEVVASIGAHLRQEVQMPLVEVLKETAALLNKRG